MKMLKLAMLTLIATLSLDLMSATSHDKSLSDVDTPCVTISSSSTDSIDNPATSVVVNSQSVQAVAKSGDKEEFAHDAKSMFTIKNIIIAVCGLIALLPVSVLLRNMISVR